MNESNGNDINGITESNGISKHDMPKMSRFRRWINRDDGKWFRIGNESVPWSHALGVLLLISGVLSFPLNRELRSTALNITGWILVVVGGFLITGGKKADENE
jgi:hypothetical protein